MNLDRPIVNNLTSPISGNVRFVRGNWDCCLDCCGARVIVENKDEVHTIRFEKDVCCLQESFVHCLVGIVPWCICCGAIHTCYACATCTYAKCGGRKYTHRMVMYDNNHILEPKFTENGVEITIDNSDPGHVLCYKIAVPPTSQNML